MAEPKYLLVAAFAAVVAFLLSASGACSLATETIGYELTWFSQPRHLSLCLLDKDCPYAHDTMSVEYYGLLL